MNRWRALLSIRNIAPEEHRRAHRARNRRNRRCKKRRRYRRPSALCHAQKIWRLRSKEIVPTASDADRYGLNFGIFRNKMRTSSHLKRLQCIAVRLSLILEEFGSTHHMKILPRRKEISDWSRYTRQVIGLLNQLPLTKEFFGQVAGTPFRVEYRAVSTQHFNIFDIDISNHGFSDEEDSS